MYKNKSNRNKLYNAPNTLYSGQYCVNCGKHNHTLTMCTDPHNSYGLLCFYRNPEKPREEPKLLMIRRKHTIPYMDFLRGKYDVNNLTYLINLFSRMTYGEIQHVISICDFEKLRNELGLNNIGSKQFKMEYETSELKFNYLLKLGILHKIIICINKIFNADLIVTYNITPVINAKTVELEHSDIISSINTELIQQSNNTCILYKEPEWGLPKGKREDRESDLQTAIREFCEETGLQPRNLHIYKNAIPLEEQYISMNNICYKHTYFIAELINVDTEIINKLLTGYNISCNDSEEQNTEISKIMLLNQENALNIVRPYHQSKRNIIHKAFYIMNQYKTFFY